MSLDSRLRENNEARILEDTGFVICKKSRIVNVRSETTLLLL